MLVAAAEEERFNRERATSAFPIHAIRFCLRTAGLDARDIDVVAIAGSLPDTASAIFSALTGDANVMRHRFSAIIRAERLIKTIRNTLALAGIPLRRDTRVVRCAHHWAHAAHAVAMSADHDNPAALVIDGVGGNRTISAFTVADSGLYYVAGALFPDSLGKFYGAISRYLGFRGPTKDGKTMALAAHGAPRLAPQLGRELFWKTNGMPAMRGHYVHFGMAPMDPSVVTPRFIAEFGPPRDEHAAFAERHVAIAASAQLILENAIVRLGRRVRVLTRADALVYAGGVALNCTANMKLAAESGFRNVFVPPGANDAGLSIGAAAIASGSLRITNSNGAYLGPAHDFESPLQDVSAYADVKLVRDLAAEAANILAAGNAIGWFQGRAEFGPRALGHRSILADPRDSRMREWLNGNIKHRERFRPFAPIVIEDDVEAIFMNAQPSRFMTSAFLVRPEWRSIIPAAIHIDGTARIQTVAARDDPTVYELLLRFKELTGVPVLLNTSLNGPGEPIALNASDAVRFFRASELLYLFLGDKLLKKKGDPSGGPFFGARGREHARA
jgi:carbamoyltransferase